MNLLSQRGESNKTYANKVLYEASYEAPLTRKTRLKSLCRHPMVNINFEVILTTIYLQKILAGKA